MAESIGRGCGKLYLTGEYAVMSPEGLAVIAGVDRYVTARCTPCGSAGAAGAGSGSVTDVAVAGTDATATEQPQSQAQAQAQPQAQPRVFSSYYGERGRAIDLANPDDPDDIVTHVIALVYRIAAAENQPATPVDITIDSDLDDAASNAKYGLGSSGAVAVAVTRALGKQLGLHLDSLRVFKIAMVATLLAGAAGSGGDIACSAHGGVVLYRRAEPEALAKLVAADPVAATAAQWPNLRIESRADLGGLNLLVGWTGSPVKTDSQLAKAGGLGGEFVSQVSSLSGRLWRALADGDHPAAYECVRANRALLQDYERHRAVCIETDKLKALADVAESAGAAGKSSGSGGGDCGIALATAGVDGELIAQRWRERGIEPLPLRLAEVAG